MSLLSKEEVLIRAKRLIDNQSNWTTVPARDYQPSDFEPDITRINDKVDEKFIKFFNLFETEV